MGPGPMGHIEGPWGRAHGPRSHGPRALGPWTQGPMGPWAHGLMDPWTHEPMGTWAHGPLGPGAHGALCPPPWPWAQWARAQTGLGPKRTLGPMGPGPKRPLKPNGPWAQWALGPSGRAKWALGRARTRLGRGFDQRFVWGSALANLSFATSADDHDHSIPPSYAP